jgi:phospholipid/cholesterol/gamma-HCH transport system ATP-binding protein
MREDLLRVYKIYFSLDGKEILKGVSFFLTKGEVLQILGEKGAGKTTLFKICLGILKPTFGEVFLFDKEIFETDYKSLKELRKKIGVVFQEPAPINNISIFENVALPLRYHYSLKESEIRKRVNDTLERFGLKEFSEERPVILDSSGGVKLEISRSFVTEPEIFFFDEFFPKLKFSEKINLLEIFSKEKERGKTFFVITNDKFVFKNFSTSAILLENGKILFYGKPQEIEKEIMNKNIFE